MIGDAIGDPLKDTSGPSLNIFIKLMAVESLVFAPFLQLMENFSLRSSEGMEKAVKVGGGNKEDKQKK